MRVELSKKPLIDRAVLERLGDERLSDAKALNRAKRYSAAIYLAGYAVECWLKVAICARLEWEQLYPTFKIHDLEVLLLHSGLESRIAESPEVANSFQQVLGVWKMDDRNNIRYKDPAELTAANASDFLGWVDDPNAGILPWVEAQI